MFENKTKAQDSVIFWDVNGTASHKLVRIVPCLCLKETHLTSWLKIKGPAIKGFV